MNPICLATNNLHKIEEIKSIFNNDIVVKSLAELNIVEELPETGNTLEANSLQKAKFIFDKYKFPCIADDSGLEIEVLNNLPGVDTAHYAGPQRNAADNMNKVLTKMLNVQNRKAVFKTVITYINLNGEIQQFIGEVDGEILHEKIGEEGFGYDPIFKPKGYDKSFAQMILSEKNRISHRARALEKFYNFLNSN
ncbi:MAG: RdgB/HAM1 family non-canonical purine NTP pyrophosphatase [Cytophagales bacterium]